MFCSTEHVFNNYIEIICSLPKVALIYFLLHLFNIKIIDIGYKTHSKIVSTLKLVMLGQVI
jgi:hypothetical protein